MEVIFSIIFTIVDLAILACIVCESYNASKNYDEYKKTGEVMKFHRAVFSLLIAMLSVLVLK